VLIKAADPDRDIGRLEALLRRTDLSDVSRVSLERELFVTRRGRRGERDAQYEIEFHLAQRPDVATIHGLRIESGTRSAQIDHVVITRFLDIWVCESKAFTGRIAINDYGEWEVHYGHKSYGVRSPVLQAWNHLNVLAEVLAKGTVPLPKVAGDRIVPTFKVAALFSNKARITRPVAVTDHLETELRAVMKVERLYSMIEATLRERDATATARGISSQELVDFATKLAGLHAPRSINWAAKVEITQILGGQSAGMPVEPKAPANVIEIAAAKCASCHANLRRGEIAYCTDRASDFGNGLYCFRCQPAALVRASLH